MESIKPEYGFKVINNADSVEYKVNQCSLGFGTGCLALVAGPFILWIPIVLFIYVLHKLGNYYNSKFRFLYVYNDFRKHRLAYWIYYIRKLQTKNYPSASDYDK